MQRADFNALSREDQIARTWEYRRRPLYRRAVAEDGAERGVAFMCPVLRDENKEPLLIDGEPFIRIELRDDLTVCFRRREGGLHKGVIVEEIELEHDFAMTPVPRADGREPIDLQRLDSDAGFTRWLAEKRAAQA